MTTNDLETLLKDADSVLDFYRRCGITASQISAVGVLERMTVSVRKQMKDRAKLRTLLKAALRTLKDCRQNTPYWSRVGYFFGIGSSSSKAVCENFGLDPETGEKVGDSNG